eukprot:SAG31_NODE_419_length_15872_cov_21.857985_1_plen_403_part_00
MATLIAAILLSMFLHSISAHCSSDDDCSLLGVCVPEGPQHVRRCKCDAGWRGTDCGEADLLPLDPAAGYANASAASWGGRAVFADGRWHLFVTEMAHRCPLILFMNNSAVVRAEADAPQGPYTHKQTILPPFHHNPQIFGPTPDGYYLLFSIGNDKQQWEIGCAEGVPMQCTLRNNSFCRGSHMPTSNGRVNLAYSQSVYGPWEQKVILPYDVDGDDSAWNCENNNPTATILSNGTVVLVYRADPCKASAGGGAGGGESLGVAVADHWNGSYVRRTGTPIVSPSNGTGMHEVRHGLSSFRTATIIASTNLVTIRYAERHNLMAFLLQRTLPPTIVPFVQDPFLWVDLRGFYHIITHNQGSDNVCGSREAGSSCAAHLFSRDSFSWKVGRHPVYNAQARRFYM